MIELNFTIIVQAFNFLIVCLLLKAFLFKPAIKLLNEEERKKTNLSEQITEQKDLLDQKLLKKEKAWGTYRSYFGKHTHMAKTTAFFSFKGVIEKPKEFPLSSQEKEQIETELQNILLRRVDHVS